jgi:hypothetical protein
LAVGFRQPKRSFFAASASPPPCRYDITNRSHYEIRLIERNVMAAALGHDLLADTRQREQSRLISVALLFAFLTGGARVFWKSSRQDDEWDIRQHRGASTRPAG